MADEPDKSEMLAEDKASIHFNTLMIQAQELISEASGSLWTDRSIHDPGVTLLESLAWNISDIGYRALLPVQDLLTPKESKPGDRLFPDAFLPEQMLTTSPVTLDDYRRGILDLACVKSESEAGYYFSDVRIVKQEGAERFTSYYDESNRQFVFNPPEGELTPLYLNGRYNVTVERNYSPLIGTPAEAEAALHTYLNNHRNLCESFAEITIIDTTETVDLTLELDLSEPSMDISAFLADLFIALNQAVSPPIRREEVIPLTDGSYAGPFAKYGWITELQPAMSGDDRVLTAGQFVEAIEQYRDKVSVRYVSLDNDKLTLFKNQPEEATFLLWGNASSLQRRVEAMLSRVRIYQNDAQVLAEPATVLQYISQLSVIPHSLPTASVACGRYRNLENYTPASSLLPALYNLQSREKTEQRLQLQRFMQGFEQQLADRCAGLETLSRMLNFSTSEAEANPVTHGSQWPYKEGSPYDTAFTEEEQTSLLMQDSVNQQSLAAELALLRYLLSYFDAGSSEGRVGNTDQMRELILISRRLLQQMPEIGYTRALVPDNKISSLQRRLAARLGYGADLFKSEPEMNQLPFYIVEHPLLLPDAPHGKVSTKGEIKSARLVTVAGNELLLLEADSSVKDTLTLKHLIDLSLPVTASAPSEVRPSDNSIRVTNLLVVLKGSDLSQLPENEGEPATENKDACFFLSPVKFRNLRMHLNEVLAAAGKNLTCEFSNVWLNEMSYELDNTLAERQSQDGYWKIYTSSTQPWPGMLQKADRLVLKIKFFGYTSVNSASDISAASQDIIADVVEVDPIMGYALISTNDEAFDPETRHYVWHIQPGNNPFLKRDRFSFTVSVVLPRNLIQEVGSLDETQRKSEETRIRRLIQAEMPAHIQARILWLSDDQLDVFGGIYAQWQSRHMKVGDDTLKLLRMLSIGMLEELIEGINEMRIPTLENEEALNNIGDFSQFDSWTSSQKQEWVNHISSDYLLFVAPDS